MKGGRLFTAQPINAGYGLPCVVVLCKLLPWCQAITVPERVRNYRQRFRQLTKAVTALVIFGFEVENPQALTDNEYSGFSTSKAYAKVFPEATHRMVGKGAGETCPLELLSAATLGSFCSQNFILLEVRCHPPGRPRKLRR